MNDSKNLNDKQAKERLDTYSKMGDEKQYFQIQKIKQEHEKKQKEKQEKRTIADVHYAQGLRAGLPHASYETIQYQRECEDQKQQEQMLKEGKTAYQKGENLSKWFNQKTHNTMENSKDVKALSKQIKENKGLNAHFTNSSEMKRQQTSKDNKNKEMDKER